MDEVFYGDWQWAIYGPGLSGCVPRMSGIYVLASVKRVCGLPLKMEPIYAGQARDLRRRWDQHTDVSEPNPGLFLKGRGRDLEFWWVPVPSSELDTAEGQVIRALQPPANRRGKAS